MLALSASASLGESLSTTAHGVDKGRGEEGGRGASAHVCKRVGMHGYTKVRCATHGGLWRMVVQTSVHGRSTQAPATVGDGVGDDVEGGLGPGPDRRIVMALFKLWPHIDMALHSCGPI